MRSHCSNHSRDDASCKRPYGVEKLPYGKTHTRIICNHDRMQRLHPCRGRASNFFVASIYHGKQYGLGGLWRWLSCHEAPGGMATPERVQRDAR